MWCVAPNRLCGDGVTTTVVPDDVIDDATDASSLTRSSMETMGPLEPEEHFKIQLIFHYF